MTSAYFPLDLRIMKPLSAGAGMVRIAAPDSPVIAIVSPRFARAVAMPIARKRQSGTADSAA